MYNEAQEMLKKIVGRKTLEARGIVAFYPANSVGDDIHIYESDDSRHNDSKPKAILHGLRQQADIDGQNNYQCISDFVAPLDSGTNDYVGMFAVSTGFGCEEECSK